MDIDELVDKIKIQLQGGDRFKLDFIAYTKKKAERMNPGTGKLYITMINALQRYIKRDRLDMAEINTAFLRGFETFLETEPSQRGNNIKEAVKDVDKKESRAASLYLSNIRAGMKTIGR